MLFGTQEIDDRGHLRIGGCDTVELAARYGTPLYVMDEALIRENCRRYVQAFKSAYPEAESRPVYAAKAFLVAGICPIFEQEGFWLDVSSAGEIFTAQKGGFPAEKMLFHGNNKSPEELEYALEIGIGRIVADNFLELERLDEMTRARGVEADMMVRCTPGIDPHTHRLIRTGQSDTKFGFNIQDGSAMRAIKQVLDCPRLRLRGIHCHVGSQLLDSTAHRQTVRIMAEFLRHMLDQTGRAAEELNLGGGLGIRYLDSMKPPTIEEFVRQVVSVLRSQIRRFKLDPPRLMMEPGRSIIGEAGTTLYTVGPVKTVPIKEPPGHRVYVSVDGGLSDNPRPQMYGSKYEAVVANKADQRAIRTVTIAGKHCETDVLLEDAVIAEPEPGDVLAVQCTGAYNHAMSSNYNRLPRPAVALVRDGKARIIYRRQSLDDLVANDEVNADC